MRYWLNEHFPYQKTRLLDELFQAMLEELMSGRLPAGALVEEAA